VVKFVNLNRPHDDFCLYVLAPTFTFDDDDADADIEEFGPLPDLKISDVRIVMLGPAGSGKSSFFNTLNSLFKDRISQGARCGKAYSSFNTDVRHLITHSLCNMLVNYLTKCMYM